MSFSIKEEIGKHGSKIPPFFQETCLTHSKRQTKKCSLDNDNLHSHKHFLRFSVKNKTEKVVPNSERERRREGGQ